MPNNVWDETAKLTGTYHSSEYGKMSEERLDALIAKATEDGVDILKEQSESPNE